jgi:hypothetical protein
MNNKQEYEYYLKCDAMCERMGIKLYKSTKSKGFAARYNNNSFELEPIRVPQKIVSYIDKLESTLKSFVELNSLDMGDTTEVETEAYETLVLEALNLLKRQEQDAKTRV